MSQQSNSEARGATAAGAAAPRAGYDETFPFALRTADEVLTGR
jgi:hypothetical protein